MRKRDMERARTGLPCFWLVTVTVKTTKIIYLALFLKYLLTATFVIDKNFISGQTDFKAQGGKCESWQKMGCYHWGEFLVLGSSKTSSLTYLSPQGRTALNLVVKSDLNEFTPICRVGNFHRSLSDINLYLIRSRS